MVLTKRYSLASILSLLIFTMSGTTNPVHAQENSRPAPLHLKITPSKNDLSSGKINIISGPARATPEKPQKKASAEVAAITPVETVKPQKKPKRLVTNQIEENGAALCDEDQTINAVQAALSGEPFEHADKNKKLADSLRAYMSAHNRDPGMINALYYASQETGTSFELLVIKAMLESDLGKHTIAANSSARGVFQYIDATWLALIKHHGEEIGYKPYADALEINQITRKYEVHGASPLSLTNILDLRDNPRIAALIKAYQILDEEQTLQSFKNGQDVHITDHYIVHMMGLSLARIFYKLQQSESAIIPANLTNQMFEKAIASNKYFFYGDDGNGLNATQIYSKFEERSSQKIEALRDIDTKYGSGANVKAPPCIVRKREASLNIRTVSASHADPIPYISSDMLLSQAPINIRRIKMD